ncbi:MAG: DsbA family protein [Thermoleophilia bacterium]
MSETEGIHVDVWSDIACPWCYIGKRRLETAIEELSGDAGVPPVSVTYHSFELQPELTGEAEVDQVTHLAEKYGLDAERARRAIDGVADVARSVGLDYDMSSVRMTNTVRAHQLIHLAAEHGLQEPMKERLLAAYFVEGRHLGRVDELADLAEEVGIDRDEAIAALERDRYLDAVRADQRQAAAYGIRGVPFYVIDGRYGVSGAQEPATFVQALRTVAAERAGGPA